MQYNELITFRVPKELLDLVANRNETFLIGVSVYIILKQITSSGRIKNYRSQLKTIAATHRIRVRTITKYLLWLQEHDLIRIVDKDIVMQSYDRAFGINSRQKQDIVFNTAGEESLSCLILSTIKNIKLIDEKPIA